MSSTIYLSPLWNRSVAKSCSIEFACFVLWSTSSATFWHIPICMMYSIFIHSVHLQLTQATTPPLHIQCTYTHTCTKCHYHFPFCAHTHITHKYVFRSLFFSSAPLILWIYRGRCTWMLSQNYHVDISLIHIIYLGPREIYGKWPKKDMKIEYAKRSSQEQQTEQ